MFASRRLHYNIKEKLTEIAHMMILSNEELQEKHMQTGLITSINSEKLIMGALEQAFVAMDQELKVERYDYHIQGGCTALCALFIMGKLYIANAGDCRAVLYVDNVPIPMSIDHCPDSERRRLQHLAKLRPSLLCDEYTRFQFQHRQRKKDIGTKQLYRDHNMDGWSLKTTDKNDIKPQLISGEGKRARLLDTIGVTRGFGDHDLEVPYSPSIKIKPFMSAEPEVCVYDLSSKKFSIDDVLVMASDGLWERFSNEKVLSVLQGKLSDLPHNEPLRYKVAAQSIVDEARGIFTERGWRSRANEPASYDDISVFLVPVHALKKQLGEVLDNARSNYRIASSNSLASSGSGNIMQRQVKVDINPQSVTPPNTSVWDDPRINFEEKTSLLQRIQLNGNSSSFSDDVESAAILQRTTTVISYNGTVDSADPSDLSPSNTAPPSCMQTGTAAHCKPKDIGHKDAVPSSSSLNAISFNSDNSMQKTDSDSKIKSILFSKLSNF